MGETGNKEKIRDVFKTLVGKPQGNHMEDLNTDGKIH
jgi:hypothetical protein